MENNKRKKKEEKIDQFDLNALMLILGILMIDDRQNHCTTVITAMNIQTKKKISGKMYTATFEGTPIYLTITITLKPEIYTYLKEATRFFPEKTYIFGKSNKRKKVYILSIITTHTDDEDPLYINFEGLEISIPIDYYKSNLSSYFEDIKINKEKKDGI